MALKLCRVPVSTHAALRTSFSSGVALLVHSDGQNQLNAELQGLGK